MRTRWKLRRDALHGFGGNAVFGRKADPNTEMNGYRVCPLALEKDRIVKYREKFGESEKQGDIWVALS